MADSRTRRQKLEAMARDKASLNEAQAAIRKLIELDSASTCPGCQHAENYHVGGQCYRCGSCGWSILGSGNSYGLPAGWHEFASFGQLLLHS